MNSKEIKEALKIINEPITVNCIEYKYFDEENYNKITNVYENCLWFANNLEQINLTVENLQKENQQLKEEKRLILKDISFWIRNSKVEQIEGDMVHQRYWMCFEDIINNIFKKYNTENLSDEDLKYNHYLEKENEKLIRKIQQKEDIINKITNYCKFQIEKEQDKFPKPIESEEWLKGRISAFEEILDNKGE